jgi:hypothetical protein
MSAGGAPQGWSGSLRAVVPTVHDDDHTLLVGVPLTGEPATETGDRHHGLVDVVDGDVEVNPHLACSGLRHRLEHQPRLRLASLAEVDPAFLRRAELATEQGAPESGHQLGVKAVDRDTGPDVRHAPILTGHAHREARPLLSGSVRVCGGSWLRTAGPR